MNAQRLTLWLVWSQVSAEILGVLDLVEEVLSTFGFSKYEVNLSTRPEKSVGEKRAEGSEQTRFYFPLFLI